MKHASRVFGWIARAAWLSASTPGGLIAQVIDLGRGTPEEFEAHGKETASLIVLCRHKSMFAAGIVQRPNKASR
jgi:hypothetical protein